MNTAEAINEKLNAPHAEARATLQKEKANHCPFGCKDHELDEYGYCHHLVGFTNDRVTFEPVAPLFRELDGVPYDTGYKTVGGTQPCRGDEEFVNPERVQKADDGHSHMAKAWVSDRVYRPGDKPASLARRPGGQPVNERMGLQQRLAELERRKKEKDMRERIALLEKELGEAPPPKPPAPSEPSEEEMDRLTRPEG